jgi:hypothetical protein
MWTVYHYLCLYLSLFLCLSQQFHHDLDQLEARLPHSPELLFLFLFLLQPLFLFLFLDL